MSRADNTTVMDKGQPDDYVRVSAHPRAQRSIARLKAFGGLIGFVVGFWIASKNGLPSWDVGFRALVGGTAGYVLLWLAAVTFWRQYVLAEFRGAQKRLRRQVLEHNARMEQLHADRAEALKAATQALS